jgi:hypothetical protein
MCRQLITQTRIDQNVRELNTNKKFWSKYVHFRLVNSIFENYNFSQKLQIFPNPTPSPGLTPCFTCEIFNRVATWESCANTDPEGEPHRFEISEFSGQNEPSTPKLRDRCHTDGTTFLLSLTERHYEKILFLQKTY